MTSTDLIPLLTRLRAELRESEWLEFKVSTFTPQVLGEYISALANAACLHGKPRAYLVFGVEDGTHNVVGTTFDPAAEKYKGNQLLTLWLSQGLQPNNGFEVHVFEYEGRRVVLFEINPAIGQPVCFYGKPFIRDGTSKTELRLYPDKQRRIWSRREDWSARICERATFADLDAAAIKKARKEFKNKFPAQSEICDTWDDVTLLNKMKVTIHGGVTNTALLLLGKPESSSLLSPAVAKISWLLKGDRNEDLDYEHFGPPFLLAGERVMSRIRNLTVRLLPGGTLFPDELTQYDPWVIREALHNCIAHQDYGLSGRIQVVESPNALLLTNVGSFLPERVESVIQQDAPLEIYRNPFLADAMVNLNMIDTQGGGIKKMFQKQRSRFFPLPGFDLSDPSRVAVRIEGQVLDERYSQMLMTRTDLELGIIVLLDRVQKRQPITSEDHRRLKASNLVEGRFPNLIVGKAIAVATGEKARQIRDKGFDDQYYMDLIVELIRTYKAVSRGDLDRLLMDKLPEILSADQKRTKIHNLLANLSRKQALIRNDGGRRYPLWVLVE